MGLLFNIYMVPVVCMALYTEQNTGQFPTSKSLQSHIRQRETMGGVLAREEYAIKSV